MIGSYIFYYLLITAAAFKNNGLKRFDLENYLKEEFKKFNINLPLSIAPELWEVVGNINYIPQIIELANVAHPQKGSNGGLGTRGLGLKQSFWDFVATVSINITNTLNQPNPVKNQLNRTEDLTMIGGKISKPGDHATKTQKESNETGGIDLTPANMNLQTQNAGGGIKFHLDPAQLFQLQNAPGFVPVIINIQPMADLQMFLGFKKDTPSTYSSTFS